MEGFRQWMQNEDLINISDISIWASSGEWKVWKNLNTPMQFEEEYRVFQRNLQGKAPIHQREKDRRGWWELGEYTVKEGYKLLEETMMPQESRKWKKVWNPLGIPKVNRFF